MSAIFRLWFNLQSSYTRCVGCSFRVLGVGWGERDLVVFDCMCNTQKILCVLGFSVQILSSTFLTVRSTERDIVSVNWSSRGAPLLLAELGFFRQIFEKYSNTNFHENVSRGSRIVPYGRTDRRYQDIYLNINQLDALNFIMSLFHASTCFEHMCLSSWGQNCTIQPLVSSHL